jgi:hypothetical protein
MPRSRRSLPGWLRWVVLLCLVSLPSWSCVRLRGEWIDLAVGSNNSNRKVEGFACGM